MRCCRAASPTTQPCPEVGRATRSLLLAAALAAAGPGASAHDSWLQPMARAPGLELATGSRFPRAEFPTAPSSVVQPGCSDGSSRLALRPLQVLPTSLSLLPVTRG